MALVSEGRSTLNPDAPLFVPAAFRQVEDFSPEWWQLVTTSAWYRDYWLSQRQDEDGFYDNADDQDDIDDVTYLLPETFDLDAGEEFTNMDAQLFEEFIHFSEFEGDKASLLTSYGTHENAKNYDSETLVKNVKYLDERGAKFQVEPAKYAEKPAKCMSPKCSLRRIQQPR